MGVRGLGECCESTASIVMGFLETVAGIKTAAEPRAKTSEQAKLVRIIVSVPELRSCRRLLTCGLPRQVVIARTGDHEQQRCATEIHVAYSE